jgi:hypothetical protein
MYRLEGVPGDLRGPKPPDMAHVGRMVSFLGAAQTFGAMCRYPFPNLISSMLGRDVLNFGFGGAGPRRFMGSHAGVLAYVNQSRVCVVQVMSGRSEENRLMVNPTGGQELRWRTDAEDVGLRPADKMYAELLRLHPRDEVIDVVSQTRRNWIDSYRALAAQIRVPKILLWVSTREPDFKETVKSVHGIFGKYPQMVNAHMLASITDSFDAVAMAVAPPETPALLSRFTGLPIDVESAGYYPSQQLHIRAAQALEPLVRRYL